MKKMGKMGKSYNGVVDTAGSATKSSKQGSKSKSMTEGSIGETGKFSKTMGSFGVDKNEQQVDLSKNKSFHGSPLGKKTRVISFGSPNFKLSDLAG